ncbi:hypothetical protein IF1G_05083 [Cordyceps javanica]|uniref:Uncharacterized protein n=1 Tax=Cordyceps javanica TaxID=43265 RepID=A0A545V459_9HYPO|nr:hypothetical protein IF1G_05083 [Cordyceps javanica]
MFQSLYSYDDFRKFCFFTKNGHNGEKRDHQPTGSDGGLGKVTTGDCSLCRVWGKVVGAISTGTPILGN